MSKIRVQDLARKLGMPEQDLMFKLKSIGVRVEGADSHIDTDILQAVLTGKKVSHPKEVILRDEEPHARSGRAVVPRRPPANPLKPAPRRTIIQKADSHIKTLPVSERPAAPKTPPPATKAADADAAARARAADKEQAARAAEAQAAEAKAEAAEAQAAEAKAEATEAPPAQAAASVDTATAKTSAAEDSKGTATKAAPRATGRPATGKPATGRPGGKPGGKPGATKAGPAKAAASPPRGAVKPGEPPKPKRLGRRQNLKVRVISDEPMPGLRPVPKKVEPMKPTSVRGKRRAAKRDEQPPQISSRHGGLAFKDARPDSPVIISEAMTVRDFADKLGVKTKDLIKELFKKGVMANINAVLEPELAEQIATDLGVETMVVSFEEEVQLQEELAVADGGDPADSEPRAPVVTIMGHVDHGKTSLLDAIRSSRVTESEFGGITQHIGAYEVEIEGRKIVFLDTPGHEAFTMMRARGARVTDIVILVVAADDGVMPQTMEAIDHAQAGDVPLIVAINKIDKANANADRVKKELADRNLLVEDWGGNVVSSEISALKNQGIPELLELVLLQADLMELKANPKLAAQGVVLEARKEAGRGIIADLLVQNGTLNVGDAFVSGKAWGRVRSMINDFGQRIDAAGPATPVEVTGFNDVPEAGDLFQVLEAESKARSIAEHRQLEDRKRSLQATPQRMSLDQLFSRIEAGEVKELPVILKADVQGSVEVLRDTLDKLATDKVKVRIIRSAVGAVTTNDVLLASSSDAVVIGFNVRPERNASELAEKEEVDIRLHTVIYELADELKKAMAGMLDPTFREVTKGRAEVRDTFKVPKFGVIAGCHVVEGVITRNASARLLRDNVVVQESKIASLRRFKEDATEVRNGFDCGIALERYQDVKPGDVIETYAREEVAPEV